jgi:hypothetical protein
LESAIRAADNVVGAAAAVGTVVVVAADVVDGAVLAGAAVVGVVVIGSVAVAVVAGADVVDGVVVAGVVVAVGAEVVGVVVVVLPDPDDGVGTLIGPPESVGRAGTVWGPNATGLFASPAALSTRTAPAVEPVGTVAVTCV